MMSNDRLDGARRRARAAMLAGVLVLGLAGLAACGDDDDDASDTVIGETALETESTTPESGPATAPAADTSEAAETSEAAGPSSTAAPSSSAAAASTTAASAGASTSAAPTSAGPTSSAASLATSPADSAPLGTEEASATESSVADTQAVTTTEAAAESSAPGSTTGDTGTAAESSVPGSSSPDSSIPESSGPTTTGPECEWVENDEFPLERCNAGPPVAAVQSVLQTLEYSVAVDCFFGDQTLYAVRAFQADQEFEVTGAVDEETWTALEIPDAWGTDSDGSGSIEPDEITLVCS
jgi:hypothetical protein